MHSLPTDLFGPQQLVTNPVELIPYEIDAGFDRGRPDGVFFPESAEDLSRLVRWAMETETPLIPRGAGTGLAGGAVAHSGGIVLVTARLNRILAIDDRSRTAHVQPGVTNLAVDAAVKAYGLYYPPDPASGRSSVIGGNIGTNAGGPHCFKYGVTTNYVLGVRAVLGDGTLVRLGGPALDYPEYDLLGVLVGSEGTLGFVTDAWLRLIADPPGVRTMMVSFESEARAGQAVSAVIASGLVPATLELMDQRSMAMIEEFTDAGLPVNAGAALIVEVDGHPEGLDTQIEEVAELLHANGGFDVRVAQSEAERAAIWYGRKSAAGAFSRIAPSYYLTDVTVRRSLLAPVLSEILDVCDRYQVQTANFFHAGDGNLHPLILCDASDDELMARVHQAGKEIIEICLRNDGSITGEHGIGLEKRHYMTAMFSAEELAAMQTIKRILDPAHICNPGKLLPEAGEETASTPAVVRPPAKDLPAVAMPTSAAEAADLLAACTQSGRPVRITGLSSEQIPADETQTNWLSTRGLDGIHEFAPDDLFVTVGAGTSLHTLQAFLADKGVRVPVAAPWGDGTVGGMISTNLNAPLRMRYGSLRDLLLCGRVVLANGTSLRVGRPLVKNVAGYDLPKLFVGAHGTLGLLTEVTLKLTARPRAHRTLAVPVDDPAQGLELAAAVLPRALNASALILTSGSEKMGIGSPVALLYSAEGLVEDVDAELTAVAEAVRRAGALAIETEQNGVEAWAGYLRAPGEASLLLRVGIPPARLKSFFVAHRELLATGLVDAAAGQIFLHLSPHDPEQARASLHELQRAAMAADGYATVIWAPPGFSDFDRWGHRPSSGHVMARLRDAWDPAGILNPHIDLTTQVPR